MFFLKLLRYGLIHQKPKNELKCVLKLIVDDYETMPNFAQSCSNLKYIVVSSEFLLKIIQRPRWGGERKILVGGRISEIYGEEEVKRERNHDLVVINY